MSFVYKFHDGPDRDAVLPMEEELPEVIVSEKVTARTWDRATDTWHETKWAYSYERRNRGGHDAITHLDYVGPLEDTKDA